MKKISFLYVTEINLFYCVQSHGWVGKHDLLKMSYIRVSGIYWEQGCSMSERGQRKKKKTSSTRPSGIPSWPWGPALPPTETLQIPRTILFQYKLQESQVQPQEGSEDVNLKTTKWTAILSLTEGCVRPEKQGGHLWCLGFVNVKTHAKTSLIRLMVFTVTRQ